MFIENTCNEVILMNTHIKVMEYTNISFIKNRCKNNVISIKTSDEYYQPYPFYLFRYITINSSTDYVAHYAIILKYNYKPFKYNHIINLNRSKSPSQSNYCTVSFFAIFRAANGYIQQHFMITLLKL